MTDNVTPQPDRGASTPPPNPRKARRERARQALGGQSVSHAAHTPHTTQTPEPASTHDRSEARSALAGIAPHKKPKKNRRQRRDQRRAQRANSAPSPNKPTSPQDTLNTPKSAIYPGAPLPQTPPPTEPMPTGTVRATPDTLAPTRTFKNDAAQTIKTNNESVGTIRQKERARQANTSRPQPAKPTSSGKRIVVMFIGVMFFVVAGAGIGIGYYYLQTGSLGVGALPKFFSSDSTPTEPREPSVSYTIDLTDRTRTDILETLHTTRGDTANTDAFREIVITRDSARVTPQDLFATLSLDTPGALVRTLTRDLSVGIRTGTDTNHLFVIVRSDSYAQAARGMLTWEDALTTDAIPLLYRTPAPEAGGFTDLTHNGYDMRVAYSRENQPLITYMVLPSGGIILTTTPEVVSDIVSTL